MVGERGVTGVVIDGETIEADAVICAVPAPTAMEIIPNLLVRVRETLRNVTYSSACRLVMGLDQPPLPPGWHGAIYPEDETPLMLDRSINLPGCVPPGKSTLVLSSHTFPAILRIRCWRVLNCAFIHDVPPNPISVRACKRT